MRARGVELRICYLHLDMLSPVRRCSVLEGGFVYHISISARDVCWALISIFWVSELLVANRRRATRGTDRTEDRSSLRVIVVLFWSGWLAAWFCYAIFPQASFESAPLFYAGLGLIVCGTLLRWWSIATLGQFFTVNVAIRTGHRVVTSGPYRLLRHPSYTALLMVFLGIGLCMGNTLSIAALMLSTVVALLYRMRIEETLLLSGLGEEYRAYMSRTKRLIPGLY
jgi:protein-S-isoprenylcysteine O-methyltransferase